MEQKSLHFFIDKENLEVHTIVLEYIKKSPTLVWLEVVLDVGDFFERIERIYKQNEMNVKFNCMDYRAIRDMLYLARIAPQRKV